VAVCVKFVVTNHTDCYVGCIYHKSQWSDDEGLQLLGHKLQGTLSQCKEQCIRHTDALLYVALITVKIIA
jgi:hypothetical protein